MEDYLTLSIQNKRAEVEAMKFAVGESQLFDLARRQRRTPLSLKGAVRGNYSGIIAEFKRRTPLQSHLNPQACASSTIKGFALNGASAVAVVTDTRFYGGAITDLATASHVANIPILRVDMLIDKYQILESYVYGADAVLLFAEALARDEIEAMMVVAHRFGMEVVLAVGSPGEIAKIPACTDIIAVNSRNLHTQTINRDTAYNMMSRLPADATKVAMSGICSHNDLHRLRTIGYSGFIIGETFMKKDYPALAMHNFINPPKIDF